MSETTELAAAVQAAHDKVTDMCSGSGRWTMSIPVRLDHDHDVVITRALTMQADALAAARREGEAVTQRAIQAEADLATSRAALEDVRRVVEYVPIHFNSHVYREAILRALAQEAGDAK